MTTNQESFDQIYEEYYPKVFSYMRSHINHYYNAQDLSEDVFVKAFKNYDSFDETKSSLSTWIFNITKNTLIDYYRTNHIHTELIDNYEYEEVSDVDQVQLIDLSIALNHLDDVEKDIIILRYYEGYTLREIAKMMHLSYGVTKLRHNKALADLKKQMSR